MIEGLSLLFLSNLRIGSRQLKNLDQINSQFLNLACIYNNFTNMAEQTQEELSQYEKFRLFKLVNRKDDDNFSAHFSNISANISMMSKSQRQIKINSFRSSHENEEDFRCYEIQRKNKQNQEMALKYAELQHKYNQLYQMFKLKEEEAEKYKKLYEEQLNREKQTKQKLKNWVKEAKTNLTR